MQAPYNDRWERTKRYLLRNFLVNPGFQLSPIPEEERSSPDSSSSLPELVIEQEPNRHDEGDAFYAGLERRMRRYYRQLFLGETGSEDDEISDFEVNRSMTSTFIMEDVNTEHEAITAAAEVTDFDENISIINERLLRESTDEFHEDVTRDNHDTYYVERINNETNKIEEVSIDHSKETIEKDGNPKLIRTSSGSFKITINETVIDPNINSNDDIHDYHSVDNRQSLNEGTFESDDLNLNDDARQNIETSKTIKSKSDTDDSTPCHRVSSTVVEIHEERPLRMTTRAFDDGSPVLLPRCIRFGRSIFGPRLSNANQSIPRESEASGEVIEGNVSANINDFDGKKATIEEKSQNYETEIENIGEGEIVDEEVGYVEDEVEVTEEERRITEEETVSTVEEVGINEEESDVAEEETDTIREETEDIEKAIDDVEEEIESIEEETVLQRLLTASEITNASHASAESPDESGLLVEDDDRDKEVDVVDKSSERSIEDPKQVNYNQHRTGEETIGTDEFNYSALDNQITEKTDLQNASIGWDRDDENESFESALRKGVFESMNVRKTLVQSTDEEMESVSEHFEPVEEMRRPRDITVYGSLVRESAGTGDSPEPAFEGKTSPDKLDEVSSDLETNTPQENFETECNELHHTPSLPKTAVVSALHDFWSVSPIQVDIGSPVNENRGSKRMSDSDESTTTKRKRKDEAVQVRLVAKCSLSKDSSVMWQQHDRNVKQ